MTWKVTILGGAGYGRCRPSFPVLWMEMGRIHPVMDHRKNIPEGNEKRPVWLSVLAGGRGIRRKVRFEGFGAGLQGFGLRRMIRTP